MKINQSTTQLSSFENYKIFAENITLLLWITDEHNKILFANTEICKFLDKQLDELIGQDYLNLFNSFDIVDETLSSNQTNKTFVLSFYNSLKEKKWLEIRQTLISGADFANYNLFIAHDITQLKNAEEQYKRIQKELKTLIKILNTSNYELSPEELLETSISTIFDFFGDYRISLLWIDDDNKITLKNSIEPKNFESISQTTEVNDKLQDYLSTLQINGYLFYNKFSRNNSENLLKPVLLDYECATLIDIPINFEQKVIAILRIDTQLPKEWMKDEILAFAEIGKNLSNLYHKKIYELKFQNYERQLEENYQKLEDKVKELDELKELYRNRSEELFINRELLEEQAFSINLLNLQLYQKEEQLQKINNDLEKAIQERDKFFSIIAHDLRGPLSSFIGMTKMISEQAENFTKDELVEISVLLHKNAQTLYSLIENLLTWSKLKRDLIEPEFQKVNLKVAVDVALNLFNENIRSKELIVSERVASNHFVDCDLNMLETIIRNLLSNAIKFTPRGGKIFLESAQNDDEYIKLTITDTGIGMSNDMIEKVFKVDEKVSHPGTEGEPSSGLGLVLCKELVEKMNGRIELVSAENKGTKFDIYLKKFDEHKVEL